MGCTASNPDKNVSSSKRLLEEYSVGAMLGEGAFGVVYACTNRLTNEEVAVKMVDKVETPVEAIRKEADMLKCLDHYNIVKFHQVFFERCFVCIVMDKYSGGDLVEGLHLHHKATESKLSGFEIVHVCQQMASSIAYLHNRLIVHRDVKGDNYLMDRKNIADPNCRIALSDFGTAYNIKAWERLNAEVGTRIFWAPEFYNKNYGLKVDVWAMGVILYGLLDGKFPFKDENDIRNKEPKYSKRIHPDLENFMKSMLHKDEEQRSSAEDVLNHVWLTTTGKKKPLEQSGSFEAEPDSGANTNMRQDGADLDVHERRRELMSRLNNEHKNNHEPQANSSQQSKQPSRHYWAKWFTIVDRHTPGSTLKFEWWSEQQVKESGILKSVDTSQEQIQLRGELDRQSPEIVGQMLRAHNIDTDKFGVGAAKTLDQLAKEVHGGAARLMLDATTHKKIVRVVDVVLLRLYTQIGDDKAMILIETGEKFPDGRRRGIDRLPGTKKEPYENSKETAQRILSEMLSMGDCPVHFKFDEKEVFEEENESPSYPGVNTVYRKEVVVGYITNPEHPLVSTSTWSAEDKRKNVKYLTWMSEKQALNKNVKLRAAGSEEVSGLVSAPIGKKEDELAAYLQDNGVDVSQFGQDINGSRAKTLKEFSTELIKGESGLVLDDDGSVVRVVDLVIMMIKNPVLGDVLVQTEHTFPDGSKNTLNRLPGAKRRPDENQFLTARRILRKQLKIDETQVKLEPGSVKYFEEERNSQLFPGVKTVYRTRLITALLTKNS